MVSWENLLLAARKAQRGKRTRREVQKFNFDQERALLRLQGELGSGDYRPGAFRTHWVQIPKPRLISVAPYRDRVVHHALMNILEPILDRHFHPDSYACRAGKGVHAAASRLQYWMDKRRYLLRCDVQKFFPSIDHDRLKGLFRNLFKDRCVLNLMDIIVDGSNDQVAAPAWFAGDHLFSPIERRRGLPIGNLTSQWFGNWYLNDLDHFVTSELRIGPYVRYCDDFLLLADDREMLVTAQHSVREFLEEKRLLLHDRKCVIQPTKTGLTFVGYRTWSTHRLLRKENVRAFRRRVCWMQTAYAEGRIEADYIRPRLASWMGHAQQANSRRLIRRLRREWIFVRGRADGAPGDPRRRVEQQCHKLPDDQPQQQHRIDTEQQQRVPSRPAFSEDGQRQVQNCAIYGWRKSGSESPGPFPVSASARMRFVGRMCVGESDGAGRHRAERPVRLAA